MAGYKPPAREAVTFILASDIQPKPTIWLWRGWLAAGKMHILGGAPGTGKTTLAMSLAAIVSSKSSWPDLTQSPGGNVVIWSGEDDPEDTLIPRLRLAGADMSKIYFISGVQRGDRKRAFDPANDVQILMAKMREIGDVRLLIVDPIVSAITGDSHKNAEVRRGLQPLVDLAAELKCALVGITHFSKGTSGHDPVERLTGSLAFGALARIVLVVAKLQDNDTYGQGSRIFCRAKSNIGPDHDGFLYVLNECELIDYPGISASVVSWGECLTGSARDLLKMAEKCEDDTPNDVPENTASFLSNLLQGGSKSASEIRKLAADEGISYQALNRASNKLGVTKTKDGMQGGWLWTLRPELRCESK